ncbi:uncharacterized protein METZ01_LOCUS241648, partial [marine metagenome]
MFSLKEWNFEEYKAAAKEIEDPVDRLDELNAMRSYAFIEEMESHRVRIRSEEDLLISQRFHLFLEWVDEEIKSMKVEFADLIKEREKKAWKGHVRLPYPVVWDRDSYNKIEPEVREKGKKREWIEWLLKNLNEGNGKKWTYEQWVLNAVENEDYYLDFAENEYEINSPSILVGAMEDQFIVFLFNVQKVLSLKDEKKRKRAIDREPIEIERNELEKIIWRTMKSRKSRGMSLRWLEVLRDLKNHTEEDQRIVLSEIPAPDESMKKGISLYIDGYST